MKYMLLDVTTPESTSVLAIAPLRPIQLLGRLAQASGKKVIAPPVEGRSFSKLEHLPLQYLYWSLFQQTPPEDYSELVKTCLAKLNGLPVDQTPVDELEAQVAKLCPEVQPQPKREPSSPRQPGEAPARPKATTTTGLVWEIADQLCAEANGQLPDRKAVIAACEAQEINPSTASTQYGKWKAAKLASQVA